MSRMLALVCAFAVRGRIGHCWHWPQPAAPAAAAPAAAAAVAMSALRTLRHWRRPKAERQLEAAENSWQVAVATAAAIS